MTLLRLIFFNKMICNFYQHSPDDIDRTVVVASYEVTKERAPLFVQRMEDYMAFYFLLNSYCTDHEPSDVTIYTFDLGNERMHTINANCRSCCKTHYQNMHHVNFIDNISEGKTFAAQIQARNKFLGIQNNQKRKTPNLIYQWPLLVILFCFSKKNYHFIFV